MSFVTRCQISLDLDVFLFVFQVKLFSYMLRKILNELSSDVPAVPKIEEEEKVEEETLATSSVATVTAPSSIYQTSSGQYSTSEFITHNLLSFHLKII